MGRALAWGGHWHGEGVGMGYEEGIGMGHGEGVGLEKERKR